MRRVLVFTRTKHGANKLAEQLERGGIQAEAIHGNKIADRPRAGAGRISRTAATRVLVATDIAARGIDVDDVTHVINYDLPNEPETYVHRIGRTARAGASGIAISFCDAEERAYLRDIEKLTRQKIPVVADHAFAVDFGPLPMTAARKPAQKQQPARRPSYEQQPRRQQHQAAPARPHSPGRARRCELSRAASGAPASYSHLAPVGRSGQPPRAAPRRPPKPRTIDRRGPPPAPPPPHARGPAPRPDAGVKHEITHKNHQSTQRRSEKCRRTQRSIPLCSLFCLAPLR